MMVVTLCCVLLYVSLAYCMEIRSPFVEPAAVDGVLQRLPNWVSDEFPDIRIGNARSLRKGSVRISINSTGQKIVVAESAVDALYGIHYFLRKYCGSSVSWSGRSFSKGCDRVRDVQIDLASPAIRFFGNPVTFSYSFAWWDWNEWEPFIDWLALSGFNMMLAPIGQELIWKDVWRDVGVSEQGISEFLVGPPFQAWNRMGNLHSWGGPVSDQFLLSQFELNVKIITRLTSLGIVPVLPTFAGFVPEEMLRLFPESRFRKNACWNKFNETYSCSYSLHPSDPLFRKMSTLFIEKQKALYGPISNVYSADPFNEMFPKGEMTAQRQSYRSRRRSLRSSKDSLPAQTAQAIYEGCKGGDENCIWMLQGWMFTDKAWTTREAKTFLAAVPTGRLLILDSYAEEHPVAQRLNGFWGHDFVWCLLHNFGGTRQLRGNLKQIAKGWHHAQHNYPNLVGGGLAMEAIGQNYVVYQFAIDALWSHDRLDVDDWLPVYSRSRYSTSRSLLPAVLKGWSTLAASFYAQPPTSLHNRFSVYIYERPRIGQRIKYWFDPQVIPKLAASFLTLNASLGHSQHFREDLHDILREDIQHTLGNRLILRVFEAYAINDSVSLLSACATVDASFAILDSAASYDIYEEIDKARSRASSSAEADRFETNTRNMLTLWGPAANIKDYAHREWSGLIANYYRARWNYMCETLINISGNFFDQRRFEREVFEYVEKPFTEVNRNTVAV